MEAAAPIGSSPQTKRAIKFPKNPLFWENAVSLKLPSYLGALLTVISQPAFLSVHLIM